MVWWTLAKLQKTGSSGFDQSINATIDEEYVMGDNSLEDSAEDEGSYVVSINDFELSQIYDRKVVFQFFDPFDARVKLTTKINFSLLSILSTIVTITNLPLELDKLIA